ncbi:MAG: NAD(P)/FAD-dependent oxidoreductase [Actinomycetota bacterium]
MIGAGFGGLTAAQELADAPVDVTVVDRRNHHVFQPLLYQVATAGLNPSEIAAPIRRILRNQSNAQVVLAEAQSVDTGQHKVILTDGEIPYDYLILATGVTHSYFGHDEWGPYAPGLKSLSDALQMRRRLLVAFEAAERETPGPGRDAWMTFVVVGAGPTGVELAGSLAEIARHSIREDFRRIDPHRSRIILVEGDDRVLPAMHERLSPKAQRQLEKIGVQVRTKAQVTGIDASGVYAAGEHIPARTVFWAAGVEASPIAKSLNTSLDKAGRVLVKPDLSVDGDDRCYVIGDLASLQQDGKPVPGVAQAALQQGRYVAESICKRIADEPVEPFVFRDKGTLATIGRAAAVAEVKGLRLWGMPAWLAWLSVHIWFLIGFRNRFVVMMEWARSYFTYEKQARLITDEVHRLLPEDEEQLD